MPKIEGTRELWDNPHVLNARLVTASHQFVLAEEALGRAHTDYYGRLIAGRRPAAVLRIRLQEARREYVIAGQIMERLETIRIESSQGADRETTLSSRPTRIAV